MLNNLYVRENLLVCLFFKKIFHCFSDQCGIRCTNIDPCVSHGSYKNRACSVFRPEVVKGDRIWLYVFCVCAEFFLLLQCVVSLILDQEIG